MKKGMLFALFAAVVLFSAINLAAQNKAGEVNNYPVVVDYSMTLDRMIKLGQYDYINPDFTPDNFPVLKQDKMEVTLKLIKFNRDVSSDKAIAELDKQGLRPANLFETLAFGAKYPDVQRQGLIIALNGSLWTENNERYVACLGIYDGMRKLNLYYYGISWFKGWRFLAADK